jgi:D-alanyl-lipoteichoic acid acyltransferase DltB (MBOAT superfamily)
MANNYSAAGFWRSWHRSYNQWLLRWALFSLVYTLLAPDFLPGNRYIYIPIGGRGSGILATILVFTFVALWHDLTFRLLAWGWLISLFILPEMLLTRMVTAEKVRLYQPSAEAVLTVPPRSLAINRGIDTSVH